MIHLFLMESCRSAFLYTFDEEGESDQGMMMLSRLTDDECLKANVFSENLGESE